MRLGTTVFLFASIAAYGCNQDHGGTTNDAGSGGPGTAGAGASLGGDAGAGAGTGAAGTGAAGTGGAPPGDPMQCDDGSAIPSELDSTRTVTVVVRNDSDQTRYVATTGIGCAPFGIERVEGAEATTVALGFAVECALCQSAPAHCDGPSSGAGAMTAVPPGESMELLWDARGLALCSSPKADCPFRSEQKGALQPVASGDYRFSLYAYSVLPAWCSEAGAIECDESMLRGGGVFVPYGLCYPQEFGEANLLAVDFTLADSGDVEVSLPLP